MRLRQAEVLRFVGVESKTAHRVWLVVSGRSQKTLAHIAWHSPWRQYVFVPESDTCWKPEHSREVADFVEKCNADHRRMLEHRRALEVAVASANAVR